MTNDQFIHRAIAVGLLIICGLLIGLMGFVYARNGSIPNELMILLTTIVAGLIGALGTQRNPSANVSNGDEVKINGA